MLQMILLFMISLRYISRFEIQWLRSWVDQAVVRLQKVQVQWLRSWVHQAVVRLQQSVAWLQQLTLRSSGSWHGSSKPWFISSGPQLGSSLASTIQGTARLLQSVCSRGLHESSGSTGSHITCVGNSRGLHESSGSTGSHITCVGNSRGLHESSGSTGSHITCVGNSRGLHESSSSTGSHIPCVGNSRGLHESSGSTGSHIPCVGNSRGLHESSGSTGSHITCVVVPGVFTNPAAVPAHTSPVLAIPGVSVAYPTCCGPVTATRGSTLVIHGSAPVANSLGPTVQGSATSRVSAIHKFLEYQQS